MKKTLASCFFACAFLIFAQQANAQNTITGKVVDKKNVAIQGASVVVKGTTMGTVTDTNGGFTAVQGTLLTVNFGTETQEATATNDLVVKFKYSLKQLQKKLDKSTGKKKKKKKNK